jgi:hypothetical protein
MLAACSSQMSQSQQTPLKVEDIRADVVNGIDPFAGRPELRVNDPSFVDPIIADTIQRGGSDRADVVWKAQSAIERKLKEPEGLAQIEKLVAERYAHPTITKDGKTVTIDVGVVAGKVKLSAKGRLYLSDDSPYLERGKWLTTEVAKFLKLGIAQFPDASEYDVNCLIPDPLGGRPDWKYAYSPKEGIVRITQKEFRTPTYVVRNVGPDFSALTSLSPSDLKIE